MRDTDAPKQEAISVSADGRRQFPCAKCGAKLSFEPGTTSLVCPYCGHENPIVQDGGTVVEHDFAAQLAELEQRSPTHERLVVKCGACAAEVEPPPDVTSFACPYCGANIVAVAHSTKQIKPGAILPFLIRRDQAREAFSKWIRSRWFAPSALRSRAGIDAAVAGMYMPYWTYDCDTTTRYSGARGDYYYTTEWYTVVVNGRSEQRTRQVRHTRWTPASGTVENSFDDVLVAASASLPAHLVSSLEPWDLKNLVVYQDDYVSGFRAESYQVDLVHGFDIAKGRMEPTIRSTVCGDIGGDEQRIDQMQVAYRDISFKHLLLPVWVSAYRYKGKVYQFLVNARTGEVQGDRPYSAVKITVFVLAILAAIALILLLVNRG